MQGIPPIRPDAFCCLHRTDLLRICLAVDHTQLPAHWGLEPRQDDVSPIDRWLQHYIISCSAMLFTDILTIRRETFHVIQRHGDNLYRIVGTLIGIVIAGLQKFLDFRLIDRSTIGHFKSRINNVE